MVLCFKTVKRIQINIKHITPNEKIKFEKLKVFPILLDKLTHLFYIAKLLNRLKTFQAILIKLNVMSTFLRNRFHVSKEKSER